MSLLHPVRSIRNFTARLFEALAILTTAINTQTAQSQQYSELISERLGGLRDQLISIREDMSTLHKASQSTASTDAAALKNELENVRSSIVQVGNISTLTHNRLAGEHTVSRFPDGTAAR
jgi:hypothetical protein